MNCRECEIDTSFHHYRSVQVIIAYHLVFDSPTCQLGSFNKYRGFLVFAYHTCRCYHVCRTGKWVNVLCTSCMLYQIFDCIYCINSISMQKLILKSIKITKDISRAAEPILGLFILIFKWSLHAKVHMLLYGTRL